MKNFKILCTLAAAVFLSACGSSVDISKPELAVAAYWESLATDNVDQFLKVMGDPKTGAPLDAQSQNYFKEQFPDMAKRYTGKIKTITITEVKYDEAKTSARVRVVLDDFDGESSKRRILAVKSGEEWHLQGAQGIDERSEAVRRFLGL